MALATPDPNTALIVVDFFNIGSTRK